MSGPIHKSRGHEPCVLTAEGVSTSPCHDGSILFVRSGIANSPVSYTLSELKKGMMEGDKIRLPS